MNETKIPRFFKWMFCAWVFSLALYQFAENTADPDLWAHVLFGEHFLHTGTLHRVEPYSWTAADYPWVNHEVFSEAALGAAHLSLGGKGLLLLKVCIGLLTFGFALTLGGQYLPWPARAVAWALGALAVVEISFGFAARPQIFTALALASQLWISRRIHEGKLAWAIALPLLFVIWINTHGGALAGVVLLFITVVATTMQFFAKKFPAISNRGLLEESTPTSVVITLWISLVAVTASLLANPWGVELIRWLIGSVLWLRPEIDEWNPAKLGWDHGVFFILILLTALAFIFSKRRRALWEMAVCGALAVLAIRSVRHTPLFCIAALAFVPPHLADVILRCKNQFARWQILFQQPQTQKLAAGLLAICALAIIGAASTLHKEKAWTMEVPRKQYPVAAIDFIRKHELNGNLLVFFDWGEMCLWELPECKVSIDGRLDTCYPHDVISAHWKFYNGDGFDQKVLDVAKADIALLPVNLAGAFALAKSSK